MTFDSAKDKVQKLLNLAAKDSGATDDERETALKMAMAMMAKHGIEQSMLGDKAAIKAKFGIKSSAGLKDYQVSLASAAAVLYGCKALYYNRGRAGFQFVGRPDNIDAAETTLFWLMRQVEAAYKAAHAEAGLHWTKVGEFRRTFKRACAMRVWQRASEMVTNPQLTSALVGQNALVVKGYFETLAKENDEATASMKIGVMRSSRTYAGNGTAAGLKAGNKVQLHQRVTK